MAKSKNSFFIHLAYQFTQPTSQRLASSAFKQLAAGVVDKETPRKGVLTYCFSQDVGDDGEISSDVVHITQIYINNDAMEGQLRANAKVASLTALYMDGHLRPVVEAAVNPKNKHDREAIEVAGGLTSLGSGTNVNPTPEAAIKQLQLLGGKIINTCALNNKFYRKMPNSRPARGNAAMLEFHLEPLSTDTQGEAAIKALLQLFRVGKSDSYHVTKFAARPWWSLRKPFTTRAVGLCVLLSTVHPVKPTTQVLADVRDSAQHLEVVATAENWEHEHLNDLLDYLGRKAGIHTQTRRQAVHGHLFHPAYTREWALEAKSNAQRTKTDVSNKKQPPQSSNSNVVKAAEEASGSDQSRAAHSPHFTIKRHVLTDEPETLVFTQTTTTTTTQSKAEVRVPLRHLLQKMCGMDRQGRTLPLAAIYAHLAVLRNVRDLGSSFNAATDADIERDTALAERMETFAELLTTLGYAMPASGRVPVVFDGLSDVIDFVEALNRDAIDNGQNVSYIFMAGPELTVAL